MRFDEDPSHASAKKKTKRPAEGFQISDFNWSFPSGIMAMMRLMQKSYWWWHPGISVLASTSTETTRHWNRLKNQQICGRFPLDSGGGRTLSGQGGTVNRNMLRKGLPEVGTLQDANSKHWFTKCFLQPLPYLVTPQDPENCQPTSSFLLVLKQ